MQIFFQVSTHFIEKFIEPLKYDKIWNYDLHISIYCDKMGKGRRNIFSLRCSTMPVNAVVLEN